MPEVTQNQPPRQPSHWVKQMYYYAVVGLCIFFFSIGLFWFSRTQLVKFAFTELQTPAYSYGGDYNYNRQYQEDTLNSSLMITITVLIAVAHTSLSKIKS
jgi:hypothetical protein